MKNVKNWAIVHKKSGVKNQFDNFSEFETECKKLVKNNTVKNYQVEFYIKNKLDEVCEITDYFG